MFWGIDFDREITYDEEKQSWPEGVYAVRIQYSKKSLKFLSRLDEKSVSRIRNAIVGLTKTPPAGDIKPLQGYDDGRKRLRVGEWRVIFRYDGADAIVILFVIEIGNRGDIYK